MSTIDIIRDLIAQRNAFPRSSQDWLDLNRRINELSTFDAPTALPGYQASTGYQGDAPVPVDEVPDEYNPEPPEPLLIADAQNYPERPGSMAIVPIVQQVVQYMPAILPAIIKLLGFVVGAEEIIEYVTNTSGLLNIDDVIQKFVATKLGQTGGDQPGTQGTSSYPTYGGNETGYRDNPNNNSVGTRRAGWIVQERETWNFGQQGKKNVWYKPYKDPNRTPTRQRMNFGERCAYFQGKRVQAHDSRQARKRLYKKMKRKLETKGDMSGLEQLAQLKNLFS